MASLTHYGEIPAYVTKDGSGTPHRIENAGDEPLRILCACSPAYAHRDTELLEGE